MNMNVIGKLVALLGIILLLVGGLILLLDKVGIRLGQLPGDIRIETETFRCAFPLVSSILVSLILTIAINILLRILNK
ncbi:MAG: DUF2905 domain-containing protein [Anaerolineales bacterium]|jgi:hypothetical protein